jgi:hypothetical protein
MTPITGQSRATTWLAAVQHLAACKSWEDYNVILEILDPMQRDANDKRVEERVDSFLRSTGQFPLQTVAETIFPAGEYRRHGPMGVYETYPKEIYPAIKRLPELHWGTYAYRLVWRDGPKGRVNPLEYCVDKIRRQLAGKSVKTACYELSIADVGLDLPLYDPVRDRKPDMGGPCLSHVSIKVTRDRKLTLTALYRSHYYVQKALGNLLGLARLQAFICEQTKLTPGSLTCMSTYATLEIKSGAWRKRDVLTLVSDLGAATPAQAPRKAGRRSNTEMAHDVVD